MRSRRKVKLFTEKTMEAKKAVAPVTISLIQSLSSLRTLPQKLEDEVMIGKGMESSKRVQAKRYQVEACG